MVSSIVKEWRAVIPLAHAQDPVKEVQRDAPKREVRVRPSRETASPTGRWRSRPTESVEIELGRFHCGGGRT